MTDGGAAAAPAPSPRARAALVAIVVAAVLLRAPRLWAGGFHGDEPFEIFVRTAILDRGAPVLPSGVVWLYGAPLQYVGALGTSIDTTDVMWNRLPFLVLSCAAVWVLGRAAMRALGPGPGLVAAAALALHPGHVEWSANVKVYGALTLVTSLAVAAWLASGDRTRCRPALAWGLWAAFAVANHAACAFVVAGLTVGGAVLHGWRWLLRPAVIASVVVPAAVLGLSFAAMRAWDPGFADVVGGTAPAASLGSRLRHLFRAFGSHGFHSDWHALPFWAAAAGLAAGFVRRALGRAPEASGRLRTGTACFVAWIVTIGAFATFARFQPAQYVLPAFPLLAVAAAAGVAEVAALVRGAAAHAVAPVVAVAWIATTTSAWTGAWDPRNEIGRLYGAFARDVRPGEVSLGGGPHAWLYAKGAVTDHMVFGGDLGASSFERDGRPCDRYFGNTVLRDVAEVSAVVAAAPRTWYFVTDKELSAGRVLPEVHEWLTSRMEPVAEAPGFRLFATRPR